METYTIYADALQETQKALDRLAKKAARYAVPFSYTVGAEHPETVRVYAEGVGRPVDKYSVAAVDITLDADGFVKKQGWTVCAHIEHGENGNIVTALNGAEPDSAWYNLPPRCDHCRTSRFRSRTFLCRNEDGTVHQVGRSCLKDYTGINPAAALLWAEVRDLMDRSFECTREEWEQEKHPQMYDVHTVLALAADEIKRYGYRKSGERDSTRDAVAAAVSNHTEPTAEGLAMADTLMDWLTGELHELDRKQKEWYRTHDADSEECPYERNWGPERNCIPLALSGYARLRHFGLLAYMPLAYTRYMEHKARMEKRAAEKEAQAAASRHVGEIKERLTIHVAAAVLLTSWDTDFGTTWLYKFTDTQGNVFIWKASNTIKLHENMVLKGTVKEHGERNGIKQTVITRCKVVA